MKRLLHWIRMFIEELRRRRVIRVAVVYAGTAFVILQLAEILVDPFGLGPWALRLITLILILGFPLAIGLAWVYNITEEGVVRDLGEEVALEGGTDGSPFTSNGLIVGLLILVAGILLYPRVFPSGKTSTSAGQPAAADTVQIEKRSIAVLPFEPLSSSEETKTFARGIHDDLLTRLANISDLKVISRTAVQQYRDTDLTTGQIADSLGVRWVMEGGVQVLQDQIQVNAQLIDPRSEAHAWAEDYQRDLTAEDLFAIQGEITREIADALQAKLTAGEQKRIAGAPTEDLRAYRLYVKGRSNLNRRTERGMVNAVQYFRKAVRQDSTYALAWSGLADAAQLFPTYGPDSMEAPAVDSEKAARRALRLDSDLAEAHASLGYVYLEQQNGSEAIRHLRRAVELKPSYAQAHHWLGIVQILIGRLEKAREHLQLAVDLAPGLAAARTALIATLIGEGDVEAAKARLHQSTPVYRELLKAAFLYHAQRWDSLQTWAEEQVKRDPWHGWARFYLARIAVRQGDTTAARGHLRTLREQENADPFFVGLVHAALEEPDEAFAAWEKKRSWEMTKTGALRYWYPDVLGPLREDPRYEKIVREVNRSWGVDPDGTVSQEGPTTSTTASETEGGSAFYSPSSRRRKNLG